MGWGTSSAAPKTVLAVVSAPPCCPLTHTPDDVLGEDDGVVDNGRESEKRSPPRSSY
jgi:hypothetical protein